MGSDPKSKLFYCHFGNIKYFIAPHLDTRSGLCFIWYALGGLVQGVIKNVI